MEKTCFALKRALEYAVVGVRGAPLYRFKKGEPLAVVIPEDIRKFRGQPDLFYECDEKGVARNPGDAAAGASPPAPRSFKAFSASAPAVAEKTTEPVPARPEEKPDESDTKTRGKTAQPKR